MSAEEPATGERVAVCSAASLAGGRLELLNRLLWACAEARRRGRGWRPLLVLDEDLARRRDRSIGLINSRGDPVELTGPENGMFDAPARRAMLETVLDALPETADGREIAEAFLPRAQESAVEAARRFWLERLGGEGLEVMVAESGAALAPAPAAAVAPSPWESAAVTAAPEVTWFGPRHLALLGTAGAQPAAALAGERALQAALTPRHAVALFREIDDLESGLRQGLERLEAAVEEEDLRLQGAWSRLRRESLRAARDFRRRAERGQRNRRGIRGARVHSLAQGLRPHDEPQERHIGFLAAAIAFQLDWRDPGRYLPAFGEAVAGAPLLLATDTGRSLPGMEGP